MMTSTFTLDYGCDRNSVFFWARSYPSHGRIFSRRCNHSWWYPHLLRITGEQIINGRWKDETMLATLATADGIVFGTPTYMGGVAGQFKCFIDAASATWFQQGWKDKIAGGFTHSGSPSGDKQGTLLYLAINAAQHGMIWVGPTEMPNPDTGVNRLGSFMGVMGNSVLDMSDSPAQVEPGDLESAGLYGQRLTTVAQKILT